MLDGKSTKNISSNSSNKLWPILVFFLFALVGLVIFELRLFHMSRSLPMTHALFFLGLVNLNLVVFLGFFYLLFRRIAKSFIGQRTPGLGDSIKSKLTLSFLGFTIIPTFLMLFISLFYVNRSIDKWFSSKGRLIISDTSSMVSSFYQNLEDKNILALQMVESVFDEKADVDNKSLDQIRKSFELDAIEVYTDSGLSWTSAQAGVNWPKGWGLGEFEKSKNEFKAQTQIISLSKNKWLVTDAPFLNQYFLRLRQKIPPAFLAQFDKFNQTKRSYDNIKPIKAPIKFIYFSTLILMTLIIIFGSVWLGSYIADEISSPLSFLVGATQKISKGDYQPVQVEAHNLEVDLLIKNFNQMSFELHESSTYVNAVLNHLTSLILIYDSKNQKIIFRNKKFSENFNKDSGLMGEVFSKELHELVLDLEKKLNDKNLKIIHGESEVQLSDLGSIQAQVTLVPLPLEGAKNLMVIDDIDLIKSRQKVKAWKEVATRVAHEINNPLTPIKLSVDRLEKRFSKDIKDPVFGKSLKLISLQVDVIKTLINEFSHKASLPGLKLKKVQLEKILEELSEVFSTDAVEMRLNLKPMSPSFVDQQQMTRAILNLLTNAREAIVEKALASEPHYQGQIEVSCYEFEGFNCIEIKDNGGGVKNPDEIFKPYVSTKSHGKGLGLSIVKKIVEDHGGEIHLERIPGGTLFRVSLPGAV